MKQVDTLIVGAGPSGLSLAYHLQGNTLILEKEDRVGGLCRSFERHGGVFDIGGHSFHTPFPEVREFVGAIMDGALDEFQRDARVFSHGQLIPYPFQKFFDQIPDPDVVRECRAGLQEAESSPQADNFEEYIHRRFGHGVAKHFMLPYNRKLWGPDLERISTEWVTERVAGAKGSREKFPTSGGKRAPLQAGTVIAYPSKGGFEEIYRQIATHVPAIEFDQQVEAIDPGMKVVQTTTGEQYHWDRLVSTMPLPELLRIIEGTPSELLGRVDRLDFLSLRVEFILIEDTLPNVPQRVYVADAAIPPHKIAFNHTSSNYLRQLPRHAIMAEVSFAPGKTIETGMITQQTIEALVQMGLVRSTADVAWNGHVEIKYGYPVYTHERGAIVQAAKEYLRSLDIYTLGRFGEWEYVNSDHCLWLGMQLARQLIT